MFKSSVVQIKHQYAELFSPCIVTRCTRRLACSVSTLTFTNWQRNYVVWILIPTSGHFTRPYPVYTKVDFKVWSLFLGGKLNLGRIDDSVCILYVNVSNCKVVYDTLIYTDLLLSIQYECCDRKLTLDFGKYTGNQVTFIWNSEWYAAWKWSAKLNRTCNTCFLFVLNTKGFLLNVLMAPDVASKGSWGRSIWYRNFFLFFVFHLPNIKKPVQKVKK